MNRKKLYTFVLAGTITGYLWLCWNGYTDMVHTNNHEHLTVCIFKSVTGTPCPSCGITRSVLALLHGDIRDAIDFNPLGIIMCALLLVLPTWIICDYIKNSNSFLNFYWKAERVLQQKNIAIPAIALVLANWVWNIYKHL